MNSISTLPQDYEPLGAPGSLKPAVKQCPTFATKSTNEIMNTLYAPVMWVVEGYLPEGFSVLAGRQKLGKTWLAIDWAIAVATSGCAMGEITCERGDVLYIDMENGDRRIQRRVETIFPNSANRPDLSRLQWAGDVIALGKGFIGAIEKWRLSAAKPRLIVIDVLQRIKPAGLKARNAYENDYDAFAGLQSWAMEHGIAVLALHHTRKGGADDPLEALTGSNGLSACADTTLVLDRDASGITLYVRGRDVEEKETALIFDGGIWSMIGDAGEVRRSDERSRILSELFTANAPITPVELVAATGMKRNNLDQLLYRMAKAGEIQKCGRGKYVHLDRSDLLTQAPPTKNDKKIRKPQSPDTNTVETFDESIDGQSNPPGPPIRNVRSPIRTEPDERESELPELPEFLRRTQQ